MGSTILTTFAPAFERAGARGKPVVPGDQEAMRMAGALAVAIDGSRMGAERLPGEGNRALAARHASQKLFTERGVTWPRHTENVKPGGPGRPITLKDYYNNE